MIPDEASGIRRTLDRVKATCSVCKVYDDHTWWCKVAPAIRPDGTRAYYWRD